MHFSQKYVYYLLIMLDYVRSVYKFVVFTVNETTCMNFNVNVFTIIM